MKICIPIQKLEQKKLIKLISTLKNTADLIEVWSDSIPDLDLKELLNKSTLPLVFVCKRPKNKGQFTGGFKKIAERLIQACNFGVSYIDIPFDMPEELNKKIIQHAKKKKVKVIISYHDFKKTSSYNDLIKLSDRLLKKGADIIKIASFANTFDDSISVIALAKKLQLEGKKHILIAMGKKGMVTRILTPTLGGEMMFASLAKNCQTAPGQMNAKDLREAWSLLNPVNHQN